MTFYNLKASPEGHASWASRLFYWWLNPIFQLGYQRDLEIDDLHRVLPEVQASHLGERLEREWSQEVFENQKVSDSLNPKSKTQHKPNLLKIFIRIFGGRFLLFGCIKFFEECFSKMAQPLCLALLIRFFAGECDRQTGLAAGAAIIICAALNVMTMHPYYHGVEKIGMQIRIACSSLLYRKAFRLSHTSLGKTTVGQMVNLLTNDASRFDNIQDIHFVWIGIIQVSISTYILWGYFGPYCLCGISVLFLFVPFQGFMGSILSNLRLQTAIQTDGRLRIISELLSAMRVIKMYAWEKPFSHLINEARRSEMKVLRKTSTFRAINWSFSFSSTQVTIFLTILVYVLDGNTLNSEKVFVCVALYSCIRITLGLHFPIGIYELGECWASIRRIQEFLLLEERTSRLIDQHNFSLNILSNLKSVNSPELCLTNLSAKWDDTEHETVLTGVTLSVKSGQLCAVVGAVGAGKSSLLMAILKELPPAKGDVQVCGTIAYVPQESWVFAGSIRENILFGKDYNGTWYDIVIEACALRHDLVLFPFGDATIVGDRGITLSGGQKARVSLARAVYANADVYLLDDPLSAVDAKVANHIFQKCISGILKSKITVLVTHQVQFLSRTDVVICIDKGKVLAQGTPDELQRQGFDFTAVIGMKERNTESCNEKDSVLPDKSETIAKKQGNQNISSDIEVESVTSDREDRLSGVVDFRVYRDYFGAGSTICSFTALVAFNIATQLAQSGSEYWLQLWTKSIESRAVQNLTIVHIVPENSYWYFEQDNETSQVWIYTGIIMLLFILSLLRTSLFFRICLNAGRNLHNRMFYSVLRAPMQFFETNSSGRIINRFSKDTDLMDDALPSTFFVSVEVLLRAFGSVVLIGIIAPYILLPTVLLTFLLLFIRRIYIRTALSIKRLEANARSPLLSHLSSSLHGITTIRAFQMENKMVEQFYAHQDVHSTTFYLNIVTNRWIGMWLDWISVVFITLVIVILIFISNAHGSEAGLAVSSALIITGAFQWGIRQSAAVETQMISIERIFRYIGMTAEAELESDAGTKPDMAWPVFGTILFKHVSLEYGSDAKVLKDISFEIRPEEKVGIIGRTGAGKSSLLSALFRLTEPTGEIEIDGVDILNIGLHNLRSKISIIPQDPVLFQGSLRKNLDPFGNYPDEELLKSINDVNLGDHVHTSANGLDMEIHEGGSNLSVGQRQLVCLARAILRKNKILVLDEATANVDLETDSLVQRKVREVFRHCTVLTIAHRISTVLDCDRIIVMDQGRVQEFDTPQQLLQNPESALSIMVAQTSGSSSALN